MMTDEQVTIDVNRWLGEGTATVEEVVAARASLPPAASSFAVAERVALMKSLPPPNLWRSW
jgi:hypothetical protein